MGALEEEGGPAMKQQLVDAIRMLERARYIDHNGHCSARHPRPLDGCTDWGP